MGALGGCSEVGCKGLFGGAVSVGFEDCSLVGHWRRVGSVVDVDRRYWYWVYGYGAA